MFVPGAGVQAVDGTNGDLIWEYQRDYPQSVRPQLARNKNIGIYEDMVYLAAPDGVLVALDAKSGKVRWETKVDDGGQTAGGMLVADGKVITSRTCPQGVPSSASSRRTTPRPARALEVLLDRGTGRARRRHLGRHAGGAARGRTWACRAPMMPSASSSIGASPIQIPIRG
jgi:hypothetical protein